MRSWICNCWLGREAVLLRILGGAEVDVLDNPHVAVVIQRVLVLVGGGQLLFSYHHAMISRIPWRQSAPAEAPFDTPNVGHRCQAM